MPCSRGCGGGRVNPPPAAPQQMNAQSNPGAPQAGMVLLEYVGSSPNTLRFVGRKTQTAYRFGDSPEHRLKYVFTEDATDLLLQAEGPGRQRFKQAAAQPVIAPMQPLVVRDRIAPVAAPAPVATESQTVTTMGTTAPDVPPFIDAIWRLPARTDSLSYQTIREAVPTLDLKETDAWLKAERHGKKRVGVLKLLEAHLMALMQEPVTA